MTEMPKNIIKSFSKEFNIPSSDLIRFKDSQIINNIEIAMTHGINFMKYRIDLNIVSNFKKQQPMV